MTVRTATQQAVLASFTGAGFSPTQSEAMLDAIIALNASGGTLGPTTFTGTATFADGATWGSAGLADSASYITSSTRMFDLSPTWTYSSTGNDVSPIGATPTLVPAGATAGATHGFAVDPGIGTSSVNISEFRALSVRGRATAGYSGTITRAAGVRSIIANSGSTAITEVNSVLAPAITNGNGITSGAVDNVGLKVESFTAAAGAGGTVRNTSARLEVPSSSSAGNTDRALWITGNGGALSTKYALYSDSTAPSQFAGKLSSGGGSFLLGAVTALSNGAAAQTATLTNAPSAGNPTKWVPIDDAGTTRYIPTWT